MTGERELLDERSHFSSDSLHEKYHYPCRRTGTFLGDGAELRTVRNRRKPIAKKPAANDSLDRCPTADTEVSRQLRRKAHLEAKPNN